MTLLYYAHRPTNRRQDGLVLLVIRQFKYPAISSRYVIYSVSYFKCPTIILC